LVNSLESYAANILSKIQCNSREIHLEIKTSSMVSLRLKTLISSRK
jgi:hypothetical protein